MLEVIATIVLVCFAYKTLDYIIRLPKRWKPSKNTKYVLITGCDSGFGNLFAKRLDSKGFVVFAACLTDKGTEELQKSCKHIKAFKMDISRQENIQSGYKMVKKVIGNEQGILIYM